MKVSEVFYSLQGEGKLTGTPGVFIRLAGCPLHCKWCDTAYARTEAGAKELTVTEALTEVTKYNCRHIVITGGEPMHSPDLPEFVVKLASPSRHITIETAGMVFTPNLPVQLMSISPKLSSSAPADARMAEEHNRLRLNVEVIRNLMACYEYQLKFVIDREDDLREIKELLAQLPRHAAERVLLMPQARTREELLQKSNMVAEMCKTTGFTFSQRLHVLLWNSRRGV
jgi:7-carboxy-7-deazaguanine synthase